MVVEEVEDEVEVELVVVVVVDVVDVVVTGFTETVAIDDVAVSPTLSLIIR